eukprot:6812952-Pyramimonas_sp.AAC.1
MHRHRSPRSSARAQLRPIRRSKQGRQPPADPWARRRRKRHSRKQPSARHRHRACARNAGPAG